MVSPEPPTSTSGMASSATPKTGKSMKKKVMGGAFHERPLTGGFRINQAGAFGQSGLERLEKLADQSGANDPFNQQLQTGTGQAAPQSDAQKKANANQSTLNELAINLDDAVLFTDRLPFNLTVALMIFLSVLVLGLEQDLGPEDANGIGDRLAWYGLECLFVVFFVVEIGIRIRFLKKAFFSDIWNVLDTLLVIALVVDAFVLVPQGIGGDIRYWSVLRGLRIIRLVRLIRMFPIFRELWLLVGGLVNSLKALAWVGIIIMMVLYVCSIVVTTEIGQNPETYSIGPSYDGEIWPYEKYFGSIWSSMFTLFQILTLDSWCDDIVRHVVYRQPLMGIFCIIFLLITAFGLMNVVIGIVVENTLAAAQVADRRIEEHKSSARKLAVEQLSDILEKSDSTRSGEISLEELRASYESDIVKEKFEKIGLSFDEAQEIFRLLDAEKKGYIDIKRFASSCRELVGGAKRRDIAQVEVTVGTLAQHLDRLDKRFGRIEEEVSGLNDLADDFVQNTVRLLTGFDGSQKLPGSMQGSTPATPAAGASPLTPSIGPASYSGRY